MAVSPLGDVCSELHCFKIATALEGRSLVLLADAEKLKRPGIQRAIHCLGYTMDKSFVVGTLPVDCQDKRFDRRTVRELVVAGAAKSGVRVQIEKMP
jgi:hypothetical protein